MRGAICGLSVVLVFASACNREREAPAEPTEPAAAATEQPEVASADSEFLQRWASAAEEGSVMTVRSEEGESLVGSTAGAGATVVGAVPQGESAPLGYDG